MYCVKLQLANCVTMRQCDRNNIIDDMFKSNCSSFLMMRELDIKKFFTCVCVMTVVMHRSINIDV